MNRYKKTFDNITARQAVKDDTIRKMNAQLSAKNDSERKRTLPYLRYGLTAVACVLIVVIAIPLGINNLNRGNLEASDAGTSTEMFAQEDTSETENDVQIDENLGSDYSTPKGDFYVATGKIQAIDSSAIQVENVWINVSVVLDTAEIDWLKIGDYVAIDYIKEDGQNIAVNITY